MNNQKIDLKRRDSSSGNNKLLWVTNPTAGRVTEYKETRTKSRRKKKKKKKSTRVIRGQYEFYEQRLQPEGAGVVSLSTKAKI